jgi:signal transduction histidine kinase/ActR/RegA family two-component response regulator
MEVLATPDATGWVEVRLLDGAGSWRVIDVAGRNLLHNRAVEGVVLNVRDVTIQRQTEEQLRHAQRMESVGRLAGGVAHDFNNLLTVIMAAVTELRAAAEAKTPIDSDLVDDVDDATSRARDLTRQLLLFARKQVVAPVPLDLNDVVANNLNLLRRTLGEDVKVVVALHDGLGLTHCDPGQASQVLMNLAVNARDAMPAGGTLTIETRNVNLSPAEAARDPELRSGSWVQLLVRDSGTGIPPEVRAHLFEPFFTTKPRGQGTGLGLATIHGIVAQSKGFIAVRSEPGHGSTFEVYLPRADASVRLRAETGADERLAPGTETVLVVDDEPSVLEAVGRTLRNAGYEVLMARDGRQALDLKVGDIRRLHLLVTDVVMPVLGGGQVATGLRAFHPNLPVLFMSGFTDNAVAIDGPREPNTHFIGKPFAPEELLAKVRTVLASAPRA